MLTKKNPYAVIYHFGKIFYEFAPNQNLCVILTIKYTKYEKVVSSRKIKLFDWQNKNKSGLTDKSIEKYLQPDSFNEYRKHLHLKILPKIDGVSRSEAEDWAHQKEVKEYCPIQNVVTKIRDSFYKWQEKGKGDRMPIEHLANEFRNILLEQENMEEGIL